MQDRAKWRDVVNGVEAKKNEKKTTNRLELVYKQQGMLELNVIQASSSLVIELILIELF